MSLSKKEFNTDVPLPEFDRTIPNKKFPSDSVGNTKKSDRIRKGTENANPVNTENLESKKEKEFLGLDAKQTLLKKKELDLDNPHQLERHSGTGMPAYLKKEKKGGGGAFNWGTNSVKEDFERAVNDDFEQQFEPETEDTLPVSENAVTFDEYIGKTGTSEIHQKVNELKEKITEDELIKDIGKAVPFKGEEVDDDRKEIQQTKIPGEDYHMSMQTLNADLLGFQVDSTVDEPKEEDTKEKAWEPTKNPIKKVINFVGEKLGLKPPSSKVVQGELFLEDDKAFPKLD